jgi:hypothetical protein
MPKAVNICSMVLVALFGGCQKEHIPMKTYATDNFSLLIPHDAEVTKKTPVEDFAIYELRYKGHTILYAYVGNHPSFASDIESLKGQSEECSTHMGYSLRSVRHRTSEAAISRHVLLHLSARQRDWPQFIHFWYSDLGADMASVSDQVIASTEVQNGVEDEKRMKRGHH